MKKTPLLVSICILLSFMSCTKDTNNETISPLWKLQTCPDEMIDNQMPRVVFDDASLASQNNVESQYYILDGQRREIKEFNEDWVKENCEVKTQTVY